MRNSNGVSPHRSSSFTKNCEIAVWQSGGENAGVSHSGRELHRKVERVLLVCGKRRGDSGALAVCPESSRTNENDSSLCIDAVIDQDIQRLLIVS